MAGAKERYEALTPDREQFLMRARHNAMLTIPSLMPTQGHDGKSHLIEPYQSLGSTGVVAMASRMTMALLPAGRPHLRLDVPPQVQLQLPDGVPPEVNQNLAKAEKLVQAAVERANWRADTLAIVQQLLVCGSVVEETLEDDTLRIHRMDNFVIRRDYRGKVLECIIKEMYDKDTPGLPKSNTDTGSPGLGPKNADDIEVYTYIKLMHSKGREFYVVTKETGPGAEIDREEFEVDGLRYRFLRWSATPGEDYGRSKVEDVVGDLRSLDSMTKQALEQGAMGAKNFIMIRPGATANGLRNRLGRMQNGDIVLGDPETVEMKQFSVSSGYQVLEAQINKLEERISRAFLLLSTQQRNAERVTATEIERDIQELESTLGGVFSALSLEMLERRTALLIEDMKKRDEFPQISKEEVQVTILTGLEALSRERDVGRGVQAAQIVSQFGEEGLRRIKLEVILDKILTGLGFPESVKNEQEVQAEVQQEQQRAMQQELLSKAAGPVAGAMAKAESEEQ